MKKTTAQQQEKTEKMMEQEKSTPSSTIAKTVAQSGGELDQNDQDFDILLNLLNAGGFLKALNDPKADLTVFAPTDAAFIQLAKDFGFTGEDELGALEAIVGALNELGEGEPLPVLQDILKYHVSPEAKTVEDIKNMEAITTLLDNASFAPKGKKLGDNEPDIADPSFQKDLTDIEASNGLIQGIDRVLIPLDIPGNGSDKKAAPETPDSESPETPDSQMPQTPDSELPETPDSESPEMPETPDTDATIADIVAQSGGEFDADNSDFDILGKALEAAQLNGAVADADADLTVFAPTDAAFVQLAQDLGYEGSDEAGAFDAVVGALTELGEGDPIPVLQDVLKYHVSPGAKTLEDIQSADSIDTLLEGAVLTTDGSSIVDGEPDIADPSVIDALTNVEASNGLIQGIDRVLIPLDIPGNGSTEAPAPEMPKSNLPLVQGTEEADILKPMGDIGNRFVGLGGGDVIFGGAGSDVAFGGAGSDYIFGKGGENTLNGGDDNDYIFGGDAADTIRGGIGNDYIFGKGGKDRLIGGEGNDMLFGSAGKQNFNGGKGDDQLFLGGGEDRVFLGFTSGTDKIYGFELGKTTLGLTNGLELSDLSFTDGNGFGAINQGDRVVAKVYGVSAEKLSAESNFEMI